ITRHYFLFPLPNHTPLELNWPCSSLFAICSPLNGYTNKIHQGLREKPIIGTSIHYIRNVKKPKSLKLDLKNYDDSKNA
ncbi:17949_t:CDS:1, partial [Cetraspora pellucida]